MEGTQAKPVRLMDLSHGSGCGCKIGPDDLHGILGRIGHTISDERVLVGNDTGDDAAVVRVRDDLAIVQTTDFFTPIMNDPYRFGQVAAANALSDVYAMAGTPLSALSLVAFPVDTLDRSILADILRGGIDKAKEAGIEIVGGHSIDDAEPKFGLAVTGTIHPDHIVRNRGARPGDVLILTKPLGVGMLTTGIKRSLIGQDLEDIAFQTMAKLNDGAARAMQRHQGFVHAATDITGFGLCGHLYGMLKESDLSAEIRFSALPLLPGLDDLIAKKCWPGGTGRNFRYVESILKISVPDELSEKARLICCDPQTSGGVLMAVDPAKADAVIATLNEEKTLCAASIGRISEGGPAIRIIE
ncbi:MAG: selenide, water dikinase SelD [Spirochaetae bacterium HGW-Spirochaetae-10]|nr:MAG: selenide, water dikinase SelD [Spirochaetae bacterium HGW-Spirochaetae-10]